MFSKKALQVGLGIWLNRDTDCIVSCMRLLDIEQYLEIVGSYIVRK